MTVNLRMSGERYFRSNSDSKHMMVVVEAGTNVKYVERDLVFLVKGIYD